MHDWTLLSIALDWENGATVLSFRKSGPQLVSVRAEGVTNLVVPRLNEWGPSVSVNEIRGPTKDLTGLQNLEIEMQSGDVIKITGMSFVFPAQS